MEAVRGRRVAAVNAGSLKLYFFRGRERDYLIVPGLYCSCRDFQFNVVLRGRRPSCYHLVVAEVLRREGRLRELKMGYEDIVNTVFEILYEGRSSILRKLMLRRQ